MRQKFMDAFKNLSPTGKVWFLLRVAHMKTVYARDAYTASYDNPDGVRLREANESMHRLTGHARDFLDGDASESRTDAVIDPILDEFARHGSRDVALLETWMKDAQAR